VYIKVKGVSCVFEKGMIIIEEQLWVKRLQSIQSIM
jgi:hypothetical protein